MVESLFVHFFFSSLVQFSGRHIVSSYLSIILSPSIPLSASRSESVRPQLVEGSRDDFDAQIDFIISISDPISSTALSPKVVPLHLLFSREQSTKPDREKGRTVVYIVSLPDEKHH